MSTKITYDGDEIANFDSGGKVLKCAGKTMNTDVIVESSGAKPEQSKTLTLGAAAPSTVTPDSGKVLSSVPVVLDTSVIKAENIKKDVQMLGVTGTHEGGGGTLIEKTITQNGTYSASADSADGYSKVTVAIPTYDGTVI